MSKYSKIVRSQKNARKNLKKMAIVKKASRNGKIFSVNFIKKDGSERRMTCRLGVKKYLKGGKNTCRHIPELVTVFSVNDNSYRNFNLRTLRQVKGAGKVWDF